MRLVLTVGRIAVQCGPTELSPITEKRPNLSVPKKIFQPGDATPSPKVYHFSILGRVLSETTANEIKLDAKKSENLSRTFCLLRRRLHTKFRKQIKHDL